MGAKRKGEKNKEKKQEATFSLGVEGRAPHSLHKELVLVLDRVLLLRISEDRPEPLLLVVKHPSIPR